MFFYGRDLEFVRPCRKVTEATIEYLNNLEKYDVDFLNSFQGSRSVYSHLDLKYIKFLEGHNCKGSYFVFKSSTSVFLFLFSLFIFIVTPFGHFCMLFT